MAEIKKTYDPNVVNRKLVELFGLGNLRFTHIEVVAESGRPCMVTATFIGEVEDQDNAA